MPVQRSLDQTTGVGFHQEYESIAMPVGFSLKINLYSTHGDLFYVGLNGIELYDQNGEELLSSKKNSARICAHPAGVHTLKGMADDTRVISNIGDGKNNTSHDGHIWLAPYSNTKGHTKANAKENTAMKREPNYVLILFEQPVALGAFKLWNYSKTPSRGVSEYELEVDGQKVYRGYARMAPEQAGSSMHLGSKQPSKADDWSTVVLFHSEARNADRLGQQINFNPHKRQNVFMLNERKQMSQHTEPRANEKFVFDEQQRP